MDESAIIALVAVAALVIVTQAKPAYGYAGAPAKPGTDWGKIVDGLASGLARVFAAKPEKTDYSIEYVTTNPDYASNYQDGSTFAEP